MTKTTTIIASAVLALSLTACTKTDDTSSGDQTTVSAASPTGDTASTGTDASTGTGGLVPDEAWAAGFKKLVPPLSGISDADLVASGKKMCADFKAAPTTPTAKAIIKDAETSFKLDSTQANMWVGGAMAHFCNDQGTKFLDASIG